MNKIYEKAKKYLSDNKLAKLKAELISGEIGI